MSKKGKPNNKYTAWGARRTGARVEIITEQYNFSQCSLALELEHCRVLSRRQNRLTLKYKQKIMHFCGHQHTIDGIERIIKGGRS